MRIGNGSDRVTFTGNDQRRHANLSDFAAQIGRRQGFTALGIPFGIAMGQLMAQRLDHLRRLLTESVREPAARRTGGHYVHSFLTHGPRAGEPAGLIANPRRRVGHRDTVKTIRGKTPQP